MNWVYDEGHFLLSLTGSEAKELARLLRPVRTRLVKDFDRLKGIHDAGEATERQQTVMQCKMDQVCLIDDLTRKAAEA